MTPSAALVVAATLHALAPVQGTDSIPVPEPFRDAVEAGTRAWSGAPGPGYWQQRVSYRIRATLDPARARLSGRETFRYENASPDTLETLVLHLYQNVFAPGNPRNRTVEVTEGMVVDRLVVGGERFRIGDDGRPVATTVELRLPEPLPPGGTLKGEVAWHFRVPVGVFRMGREGDELFNLAQWYPQVAVYDDVRGWHRDPYLGDGEFYLEYGDFDVEITVPRGWLVAATGSLENPGDVLPADAADRLRALEELPPGDGPVRIASAGDLPASGSTGTRTWRFSATNVRDFAWAASDRYVWDATTGRSPDADGDGEAERVAIHALYRERRAAEGWGEWAGYARRAVEAHAAAWLPYPYPHMTVAEGVFGGGMEYPMITFIGGERSGYRLWSVTNHEIGHMWFPMMVGSNETAHAWMDEGVTSFIEYRATGPLFPDREPAARDRRRYLAIAGTEGETPSMRHADLYGPSGHRGTASYSKPATVLRALRDVLGPATFDRALREYARRWDGRHPVPLDLFHTFEDVSGRELDWYFHPWLYTTRTLDQAISGVETSPGPDGVEVTVTVLDRGSIPMPVDLEVTTADGASRRVRLGVDAWGGERSVTATVRLPAAPARVVVDPEHDFPDVRRGDNVWTAPAATDPGRDRR